MSRMQRALVAVGAFVGLVALVLAWIGIETLVTGDNPTTTDPGDTSRVYYMDTGDCFDAGPLFDRHADVTVLDCSESHDSEIVDLEFFDTYGSEGAEAEEEAADESADECRDAFDEYAAGLRPDSSIEARLYLDDGRTSFRDRGADQTKWTVACVVWSANGRF